MTFGNILCFQVTSCPKAVQNDDTRHAVVVSVGCFLLVRERPQPRPSCSFCWKIVASETIYRIAPMDLDGLFSRDFSYRISHRLSIRAPHGIAPRPVTLCWDGRAPLPIAPIGGKSWLLPCSDKLSLRRSMCESWGETSQLSSKSITGL